MAMSDRETLRLRIEGRVQGVSYRAWLQGEARAAGLSGWVRNRVDGSVEALLHGPAEAVRATADACKAGPPAARVSHVATEPADPPDTDGFEIRETA
jgi:acylphosphatase